ncbi:hypothetical protein SGRIM128S_03011 [Streptomyces griseomycini]
MSSAGRVLAHATRSSAQTSAQMGDGGRRGDRLRSDRGLTGRRGRAARGAAEGGPGVRLVVRVRGPRSGLVEHRRHHTRRRQARLGRRRRVQHRHSGQCHRPRHGRPRERGEHRRRGGEGEPRRRRTGHQVAGLRAHRLGGVRPGRTGRGGPVRAHLRQRPRRARPAGLDPEGLHRRRGLEDPRHPLGRVLRGTVPDEGLRRRRVGRRRVPALPHRVHEEPRRRHHPAGRRPVLHRRRRRARPAGHALAGRPRPQRIAHGQGGRRFHREARPAVRRPAHRRRAGVLVQQGIRRRRGGRPEHPAVVPDLPLDGRRRPRLRRHQRLRGPRLHRRHPPERPGRRRPARVPADPAGAGRFEGPLRQPVEQRGLPDRLGGGRQDRRPDPGGVRLPRGPGEVPGLAGRRGAAAGRARAAQGAPLRLRRDHPGHQLQRRLLPRQQLPRDRRAARLQLLDPGHQRRLAELAVRLRARQQRGQPADDPGVQREPRAEPLDGRPADLPGDAVRRRRHPRPRA